MNDKYYMNRAIELAKLGYGCVNPNPLVGAVIVKNSKIIGEGYHKFYGGLHAEINALKNAKEDVTGAKMYVTLEPCAHHGKTPPCTLSIIKSGIKEVVIGITDPNPLTANKGIKQLLEAGIKVSYGVLENEIKEMNEVFLKYIVHNQPFCTLKYAMTLDGKIASSTGDSKWISNDLSRKYVHQLRQEYSSIMVGINTVLADNPRLTTRLENKNVKNPIRIIVDSKGKIPLCSQVLNEEGECIIATTSSIDSLKKKQLEEMGIKVIITSQESHVDLAELFNELGRLGIDSVLVEGGTQIFTSIINNNLADKIISFVAPKIIGAGISPVNDLGIKQMVNCYELSNVSIRAFGNNVAIIGYLGKE